MKGNHISGKNSFFAWTEDRYLLIICDSQKIIAIHVCVIKYWNKHMLRDGPLRSLQLYQVSDDWKYGTDTSKSMVGCKYSE